MPNKAAFDPREVYTITGPEIATIYEKNKMTVHFQGMSKTLQFPQTVAIQGAPTCSIGVSPYGLYNRLNDAGRLILLNQQALQFASAPIARVDGESFMLTQKKPDGSEAPDDVQPLGNYYYPPVEEKDVALSIATPSMEMAFKAGRARIVRRLVSPLLSGDEQTLMPIGVEEYEVENRSKSEISVTLVIPKPSLVNLQEKELKPTDQDSVYVSTAAVSGHRHSEFSQDGARGVVMGSSETANRMVLAVAEAKGASIDVQPYFCLNRCKDDLLLNEDGSFFEKRKPLTRSDYGCAVSVTFTIPPKSSRKAAVALALDFPVQEYIDGKKFPRKYLKNFTDEKSRAIDLAKIALSNFGRW